MVKSSVGYKEQYSSILNQFWEKHSAIWFSNNAKCKLHLARPCVYCFDKASDEAIKDYLKEGYIL